MFRGRRLILVLAVVFALVVACSGRDDAGDQPAAEESLAATGPGVSASEIRIAVVADVDSPIVPGLFQESVDGVKAWAAYQNGKGGLAGRRVVVDFYDSKTSPDEWRNATIKACENNIAMVGTTAVADVSVTELTECGIPEIPQLAISTAHQAAPNSFAVLTGGNKQVLIGAQQWFLEKFGAQGCCKGVWLYPAEIPETLALAQQMQKTLVENGYELLREMPLNARDPNYLPYVQAIKSTGANYVQSLTDFNQWALLRREASVQGVNSVLVWDCPVSCYDPAFLQVGGPAVEGQHVTISFLPFEEADRYPAVQTYLTELKKINPDAQLNGFSVGTWMGGLLFGATVEKIVADKGVNGLTRENLIQALKDTHDFDADGLTGPTDIGKRTGTSCVVVMQVKQGKFVRVHPAEGLDCDAANIVTASS